MSIRPQPILGKLRAGERGQTAAEYMAVTIVAILLAIVALVVGIVTAIIGAIVSFGKDAASFAEGVLP